MSFFLLIKPTCDVFVSGLKTMELFGLSEIQVVGAAVAVVVVAATAAIILSSKKSKGMAVHYNNRNIYVINLHR